LHEHLSDTHGKFGTNADPNTEQYLQDYDQDLNTNPSDSELSIPEQTKFERIANMKGKCSTVADGEDA
jgi:hypothetical protein